MLTAKERSFVYQQAYLPEHLPEYVESISGAEAYLHHDYLCFLKGNHLIFIGYPLGNKLTAEQAYISACDRFQPFAVAVMAPRLWFPPDTCENRQEDSYYCLSLSVQQCHPDVVYMVRRAERELKIGLGKFGTEHQQLIKEFLAGHKVTNEQRLVFEHIPHYLACSPTVRLLEARRENGVLVAFTITDLGSAHYAFYLFNFRSLKENVPGASDLLFHKMVCLAQDEGKTAINLGLGIHSGIRHFKEKWGGVPFLNYASCLIRRQAIQIGALLDKL